MLKRISNVFIQRQSLAFFTINNKCNKGVFLFTIALAVALVSFVTLSLCNLNAQAQEYESPAIPDQKQVFKVIVQVTNNAYTDEVGAIHVYINGTDVSKVLNGVVCPAKSTVEYAFEFAAEDVPVGKRFTTEMVYGDDVFKRAYGVNSPSKAPEIALLTIP